MGSVGSTVSAIASKALPVIKWGLIGSATLVAALGVGYGCYRLYQYCTKKN